jgi:hypothetical protein
MTANSCRPGAFCGVLTCCFSLIGNQVQAATHRSGADCFSCHADFKLAGTPLRPYGVGCKYYPSVSNRGNPPALPGDSQSLTDTGVVFGPDELGAGWSVT